jgi:hypothetical protein
MFELCGALKHVKKMHPIPLFRVNKKEAESAKKNKLVTILHESSAMLDLYVTFKVAI